MEYGVELTMSGQTPVAHSVLLWIGAKRNLNKIAYLGEHGRRMGTTFSFQGTERVLSLSNLKRKHWFRGTYQIFFPLILGKKQGTW